MNKCPMCGYDEKATLVTKVNNVMTAYVNDKTDEDHGVMMSMEDYVTLPNKTVLRKKCLPKKVITLSTEQPIGK